MNLGDEVRMKDRPEIQGRVVGVMNLDDEPVYTVAVLRKYKGSQLEKVDGSKD